MRKIKDVLLFDEKINFPMLQEFHGNQCKITDQMKDNCHQAIVNKLTNFERTFGMWLARYELLNRAGDSFKPGQS